MRNTFPGGCAVPERDAAGETAIARMHAAQLFIR